MIIETDSGEQLDNDDPKNVELFSMATNTLMTMTDQASAKAAGYVEEFGEFDPIASGNSSGSRGEGGSSPSGTIRRWSISSASSPKPSKDSGGESAMILPTAPTGGSSGRSRANDRLLRKAADDLLVGVEDRNFHRAVNIVELHCGFRFRVFQRNGWHIVFVQTDRCACPFRRIVESDMGASGFNRADRYASLPRSIHDDNALGGDLIELRVSPLVGRSRQYPDDKDRAGGGQQFDGSFKPGDSRFKFDFHDLSPLNFITRGHPEHNRWAATKTSS